MSVKRSIKQPRTAPRPTFTGAPVFRQAKDHPSSGATIALAYCLLILSMWGFYNLFSGLPYETAFPYFSETHPWREGFFYISDHLRIQESNFYHLSYLLGEALRIGGSYVPYQVVYALLWWARGFLTFVLIRKFLPKNVLIAYTAGALVLVYSADGATQWVGQMNQYGVIFWMLLAFLFLTTALETRWYLSIPFAALAAGCEYMSLWSYESEIFLILVFPLVLALHPARTWRKLIPLSLAWYVVPYIYIRLTIERYTASGQNTYQQSVARKTWDALSVLSDWYFNVSFSLEFWKWIRGPWRYSVLAAIALALVAAAIFVAGALRVARTRSGTTSWAPAGQSLQKAVWLLICGMVLLILSFPVFLVLDSARGLWRTQFLSGIGAAVVFAAVIWLITAAVPQRWKQPVFLFLGATIVFVGSLSAIQKSGGHRWVWERHRAAIRQVLQVAPMVDPYSMIVLTNVPTGPDDPFGDDMWFDLALRLIYPGVRVSGVYFRADGSRPPGDNFVVKGDQWVSDGTGFPSLIQSTPISNTIVIRYDASGHGALEKTMPQFVCAPDCSRAELYHPQEVIYGSISPRTLRRYNLQPGDR